jgi:uncharacterized protein (TIGR02757 family)
LLARTGGFSYRMTDARDVACLLYGAGAMLREHGSLGSAFAKHYRLEGSVRGALGGFVDELCAPDFTPITGRRSPTRRLKHLLPHPDRGSACKRLNLFLRWMVRGPDGVDFGLWREIPRAALIVPLDTHVHRIGRFIGLTRRKDLSWRTAEDITARLRHLDAEDPVRYDFALSHLGISGTCAAPGILPRGARISPGAPPRTSPRACATSMRRIRCATISRSRTSASAAPAPRGRTPGAALAARSSRSAGTGCSRPPADSQGCAVAARRRLAY